MAKTVRWTVELDESLLRALELRAGREGGSLADVVDSLFRRALAAEMDEVSGAVPLAAMIQTVIRHRTRPGYPVTNRPPASSIPTASPLRPAARPAAKSAWA